MAVSFFMVKKSPVFDLGDFKILRGVNVLNLHFRQDKGEKLWKISGARFQKGSGFAGIKLAAVMIYLRKILAPGSFIFGKLPHKKAVPAYKESALGRVGKGNDRHHGISGLEQLHGVSKSLSGEKGCGGIDAAEIGRAHV